jgi:hypothetical protein
VECDGEPVRISVCHCFDCQRRTGSVFGAQARYPVERTRITGASTKYDRAGDSGNPVAMHFCPTCGSTVYWIIGGLEDHLMVAIGAFADPTFPPPRVAVYEARRHPWASPEIDGEHHD